MDSNDSQLIRSAQLDKEAYGELYQKYYRKIYNYFWYRIGHDKDIADDLTQETFVKAYRALSRYKITKASYYSYLLTIAHNILVIFYRSPQTISLDAVGDVPHEVWDDIIKRDEAKLLWRTIQQLPSHERDMLYMKYQNGMRISEIAKVTKKTENAVKLTLSRTRKKLANHPFLKDVSKFTQKTTTTPTARYKRKPKVKKL